MNKQKLILTSFLFGLVLLATAQQPLSVFDLRTNYPFEDSLSTIELTTNQILKFNELATEYINKFNSQQKQRFGQVISKKEEMTLNGLLIKPLNEYHLQYLPRFSQTGELEIKLDFIHQSVSEEPPNRVVVIADGLNFQHFNFTITQNDIQTDY